MARVSRVTIRGCLGHQIAQRAARLAALDVPVRTHRAAGGTRYASRISPGGLPVVAGLRVGVLRLHVCEAGPNGRELVAPDPPIQDLLLAGRRIEDPSASRLHERN